MKATYHSGELRVQELAGVRDAAERIGRSIRDTIPARAQEFLLAQPMVILAAMDGQQRVWASLLTGVPGFMRAIDDHTLRIDARPAAGDPLVESVRDTTQLGVLVIEPSTRRRMRLNGRAVRGSDGAIVVRADEVFSNCHKYIQAREWTAERSRQATRDVSAKAEHTRSLAASQRAMIASADTVFIASHHPVAGSDASHRGGNPGFVRVEGATKLAWGDYSGNNMFQTLGNITAFPKAGLLFVDFERGATLQLTGRASIDWDEGRRADFAGAERVVEFEIEEIVEIAEATQLRWHFEEYSPFNPSPRS